MLNWSALGRSVAVTAAMLPGSVGGTEADRGGMGEVMAQQAPKPPTAAPRPHSSSFPDMVIRTEDPVMAKLEAVRARELREDRRRRLLLDATRLVQVSYEVHRSVLNADEDALPQDLPAKVAEIERLAHDVGQRMRN